MNSNQALDTDSTAFNFTVLPQLALYVHIPWCVRKCPYCDFNSHTQGDSLPEQEYLQALLADIEQDLPRVWGRGIKTVFIGGGTPSLFSARTIEQLLSGLRARINIDPRAEITLEANPGTVEQQKFSEFRHAGINRLSIGIQSFEPDHLQALGRIHDRRQAFVAAEAAHASGFDNFNLDLMFGLPGQTVSQAEADIRNAMDLEPAHISYYQLTIEPHTLFHERPPRLPEEDNIWEMQQRGQQLLTEQGYRQYEVSAYAREGKECRHNLNYWQFGDYLGIGAGAHGKISSTAPQSISRIWKTKHPAKYLQQAGLPASISGDTQLAVDEVPVEFMLNALRLSNGFRLSLFESATGLDTTCLQSPLAQAQDKGWLEINGEWIQTTGLGKQYLNDLISLFISDDG
jgi:putative oxygen-independent coproporphyrinogen III oxidase